MRVLTIDDDPDVRTLCRLILECAGHEALEASDGLEGIELAISERPELVLLDVSLPRFDGFSVLAELGSRPETKGIPAVMLTAMTKKSDQLRGWLAGAVEYLPKPFTPNELSAKVEQVARMSPRERARHRVRTVSRLSESLLAS